MKTRNLAIGFIIMIILFSGLTGGALAAQVRNPRNPNLEQGGHKGKVVATMSSGGYTYIEFEENGKKLWVASRKFLVKVGDTIEFKQAAPMKNFFSRTLNRTFENILFVAKIKVNGQDPWSLKGVKLPEGHLDIGQKGKTSKAAPEPGQVVVEPGSISKAEGGYTIAQCYAKQKELNGKTIKIKARVVKFTPRIMGKNWVHLKDGTGQKGTDDLTVTTKETVNKGDLVIVTGTVACNKDFGAGYVYKVILEKGNFEKVEN